MEKDVRKEVDDAQAFAMKDVEPPVELLYTDVYVKTPDLVIRGTHPEAIIKPQYLSAADLVKAKGAAPTSATKYA